MTHHLWISLSVTDGKEFDVLYDPSLIMLCDGKKNSVEFEANFDGVNFKI